MIDPRKSPVAMLPILNAVAGHMIAAAAPLRVINVEDTEQMVAEACDAGGFDADAMEEAVSSRMPKNAAGESFAWQTEWVTNQPRNPHSALTANLFLDTLQALIEESV